MLRLLTFVALLMGLLGQSVMPTAAPAHAAEEWQHAALHWQETAHRHHDGGVQLDAAADSDPHGVGDHVCCPTGLPTRDVELNTLPTEEGLFGAAPAQVPTRDPDRLLRPPRA